MTATDIFGLMTIAGLFVCMVPSLYTSFKALNMNDKMLGIVVEDSLTSEKRIYEKFWDELDSLPLQTRQVEKLKEHYQKKNSRDWRRAKTQLYYSRKST